MSHDLIIRDGLLVDGNGGEPYAGDVAVDGDTIVAVGKVDGKGKQEINAAGAAVTPGFIDLHTHLDAQVGWDPLLTPTSCHGISTVLTGNCAVSFAPCKKADRTFLAEMMETVEDIPREAILTGLPWDWESYGEYLDSVERMRPAINMAGMAGHAAIRYNVMGERGIDENPNAEEIAQIAEIAAQSVREGAVGFSTNRIPGHRVPDGRAIPGTYAEAEELEAIARAVAAEGGLMQNVPSYTKETIERDLDLIGKQVLMTRTTLLKNIGQRVVRSMALLCRDVAAMFLTSRPLFCSQVGKNCAPWHRRIA
jgi:N-acyl-D-amino-acid deacylase